MNKVLGIALGLYVLGDPGLSLLAGFGANPEYIVSMVVALVTIPWVTAQLEG